MKPKLVEMESRSRETNKPLLSELLQMIMVPYRLSSPSPLDGQSFDCAPKEGNVFFMKTMVWISILFLSSQAFAHGNHHHGEAKPAVAPSDAAQEIDRQINQVYVQRVRPIFVQKCFDCHSDQTVYPGYYKIPGIKQFMDSDIREGREHLDFSNDYPFFSHATRIEDLDSIRHELEEGDMPPLIYRLAHRESGVTDEEKRLIYDWLDWTKAQLKAIK